MSDGYESFRDCRTTIPLIALKVSTLCTIHSDFIRRYPNTQNWMRKLWTFSQIQSHILFVSIKVISHRTCEYKIHVNQSNLATEYEYNFLIVNFILHSMYYYTTKLS